jgi:hypothetical protein
MDRKIEGSSISPFEKPEGSSISPFEKQKGDMA